MNKRLTCPLAVIAVLQFGQAAAQSDDRHDLIERGMSYTKSSDKNRAIDAFSKALALSAGHQKAQPLVDRAVTRLLGPASRADIEAAIEDCDAALAVDPTDPAAYYTRGLANLALGRADSRRDELARAAADFQTAVTLKPGDAAALFELGTVQTELDDPAAGSANIAKARQLDPNAADAIVPAYDAPADDKVLQIYRDEVQQRQSMAAARAGLPASAPGAAAPPRFDGGWLCHGHPMPSFGRGDIPIAILRNGDTVTLVWTQAVLFPRLSGTVAGQTITGTYASSFVDEHGRFSLTAEPDGTLAGAYTRESDGVTGTWTCRPGPR